MAKLPLEAVRLAWGLKRLKDYEIPSHCQMYCLCNKSDRNCLRVKKKLYIAHPNIMKSKNKVFIFCRYSQAWISRKCAELQRIEVSFGL